MSKTKEIKKIIKDDITNQIPDVFSKIDLQAIEIKDEEVVVEKKRTHFGLKLSLTSAFSLLLIGAITWIVIAFSGSTPPSFITSSNERYFSFFGASAVNILNSEESGTGLSFSANILTLGNGISTQSNIADYYDDITKYLQSVETLLASEDEMIFESSESDLEGYIHKITFKTKNLLEDEINYVFYYNEFEKDDDDDEEYKVTGIVIFSGRTFDFEAEFEIEDDEREFKLKAVDQSNKKNYVEIEQEMEADEKEYLYKISIDGKTFEREYEIEFEKNHTMIEINIKEDSKEIYLEIIKRKSDDTMNITYEIQEDNNKIKGSLKATANSDGTYSFT